MATTRVSRLALLLLVLLTSRLEPARADGANASTVDIGLPRWDLIDGIDGCALCRGGDCTRAVNNQSAGVFCGELQTSKQPCCCAYVTTCAVDEFYDTCRCKEPDQLERMLFDFWGWCFLGLVAVAFFPFSILLELLVRLLAVVGLHCQRLRGSLALGGKVCQSAARRPVGPAYAAVSSDEGRVDAVADDQDKHDAEIC